MEMLVLPRMEMRDMDARTEERLKELIMEAASLVPTEGGRLLLEEGPEDSCLWGDRIGFIRLGLGLATGAFRPSTYIRGATNAVDTGVDQLIDLPLGAISSFAGRMTGTRSRSAQEPSIPACLPPLPVELLNNRSYWGRGY
jgi:hypothetical protein